MLQQFQPHEFREGESFDYLYEATEAKFTTEQVRDGRVPRVTDLVKITESRTRLRFTIVSDGATLRKQVEFSDMQFREITAPSSSERDDVPFRTGQELIPRLPEVVTHVYDLGTDGRIASDLGAIFGKYLDEGAAPAAVPVHRRVHFRRHGRELPTSMGVGDVRTRPAMDVDFYGCPVPQSHPVPVLRSRRRDRRRAARVHQGAESGQLHGSDARRVGLAVVGTCPARRSGDRGSSPAANCRSWCSARTTRRRPVSVTQRQLSMTMQTDHVHTDGGNP